MLFRDYERYMLVFVFGGWGIKIRLDVKMLSISLEICNIFALANVGHHNSLYIFQI